jgi:hypothetical protein
MTQKGPHTWDLILQYHRCPKCGKIIESRENYTYRLGKYIKELQCTNCKENFTLTKPTKPIFGPFFGEPEVAEWDWPK